MYASKTVIGIIGAGEVGSQIARAAIANGYEVVIANSRGPETLKEKEKAPQPLIKGFEALFCWFKLICVDVIIYLLSSNITS